MVQNVFLSAAVQAGSTWGHWFEKTCLRKARRARRLALNGPGGVPRLGAQPRIVAAARGLRLDACSSRRALSHATAVDGRVFVTGQLPIDPDDDDGPLPEGIEAQTLQVVENRRRVFAGCASRLDQVVFARVYLTQFERDYAAMNTVYESYFALARLPARTGIGVTGLARERS
jgi:2-iminobutanoate/2-iminopropanoate deaminase